MPSLVALAPLAIVVASFLVSPTAGAALSVICVASLPSLYRVWRRNSWLAVSRLPSRPHRGTRPG